MIDAVAKALAHWAVPMNDWDSLAEAQRDAWRDAARVAIEAMSEPTESMVSDGELFMAVSKSEAEVVWQRMIESALTPADG